MQKAKINRQNRDRPGGHDTISTLLIKDYGYITLLQGDARGFAKRREHQKFTAEAIKSFYEDRDVEETMDFSMIWDVDFEQGMMDDAYYYGYPDDYDDEPMDPMDFYDPYWDSDNHLTAIETRKENRVMTALFDFREDEIGAYEVLDIIEQNR